VASQYGGRTGFPKFADVLKVSFALYMFAVVGALASFDGMEGILEGQPRRPLRPLSLSANASSWPTSWSSGPVGLWLLAPAFLAPLPDE